MAKWISIKKQLPPKNEGVLVTDGKIITVASLDYYKDEPWWWDGWCFSGYEWDFDFESSFKEGAITHWMPLPDFPKKQRSKENESNQNLGQTSLPTYRTQDYD